MQITFGNISKHSNFKYNFIIYKRGLLSFFYFSEFGDGTPLAATAVGGLSVTGCLSDFSVYIFHPYGGKKSALKEAQWSPLSDSERKDSLSINVEFVKFHLSRSRMLNFKQETYLKGKHSGDQSRAVIRFSSKGLFISN